MTKSKFKEIRGGKAESSFIQLECNVCGWKSRKVQAYEDYQLTIIRTFKREHNCEVCGYNESD